MRYLTVLPLLAATLFAVGATPAAGQSPGQAVSSHLRLISKKPVTPQHPQGVRLKGSVQFGTALPGTEPPIVTGGRLLLPRGIVYNGARHPACSAATLRRDGGRGLKYCPKRSIVGRIKGVARTASALADLNTPPHITFVNGGARKILALTTFYAPAFMQEPVTVDVNPLSRSHKWSYELTFKPPEILLILAGVPVPLPNQVRFAIGGEPLAPRYLELARRCPERGFLRYELGFDYLNNDGTTGKVSGKGQLVCKR